MVKSLKNGWSLDFLVTVLAVTELFSQGICSPAKNVGLGICSHGIDSLPNIYVRTEEKAQKSALVGSPGCEKVCGHSIMYAVRTSGDKSVSSLRPSSGTLLLLSFLAPQWRELINFSPDVLTA